MSKPHTHTPGPWVINDRIRGKLYVEASIGGLVCDMQLEELADLSKPDAVALIHADAHLIAAAPEMLEALQHVRKIVSPYLIGDGECNKLDNIITRATGRERGAI